MAGDRVMVSGYSTRDPDWAYSDEGWFRIDNNFSTTETDPSQDEETFDWSTYDESREFEENGKTYYRDTQNRLWVWVENNGWQLV